MNYPDDIRQYDDDQRSPYYDDADERREEAVMKRALEIAQEMITPDGYNENGTEWNMDDVLSHINQSLDDADKFAELVALIIKEKSDSRIGEFRELLLDHAKVDAENIARREIG